MKVDCAVVTILGPGSNFIASFGSTGEKGKEQNTTTTIRSGNPTTTSGFRNGLRIAVFPPASPNRTRFLRDGKRNAARATNIMNTKMNSGVMSRLNIVKPTARNQATGEK